MQTAADDFTRASPTYVAAQRTNQRSGPAFEVSSPHHNRSGWWLVAIGGCAVVWALIAMGLSHA